MYALTLAQPVASAMLIGGKIIENRTWKPGKRHEFPLVVAVHAGASWWCPEKGTTRRWSSASRDYVSQRWAGPNPMSNDEADFPRSAILGLMCIEKVLPFDHPDLRGVEWALGPYCWMVRSVKRYPEPVDCKGALGLWKVPQHVALQCAGWKAPWVEVSR